MPDILAAMPAALLPRLNQLSTRRRWEIEVEEGGGHSMVRFNGQRSTVPRQAADLKAGTFRAILKQPGLTKADLAV